MLKKFITLFGLGLVVAGLYACPPKEEAAPSGAENGIKPAPTSTVSPH